MSKEYTLAGEAFFRRMMRLEEERRQRFVGGNRWGGVSDGSHPSNIISLQDYRRQQTERTTTPLVPPKPSA